LLNLDVLLVSNVYLLLDYGDFIDGSTSNTDTPYVQILSTTNAAAAHADFVETRLGGKDTTTPQNHGSGSGSGSNPDSSSSGKSFYERFRIPIFAAAAVAGAAVVTGAVFFVARRRKPVYRPLYDPAPAGAMPMQHVSGYGPPPGAPPYSDPWTNRR
jgi:hypothetical protein